MRNIGVRNSFNCSTLSNRRLSSQRQEILQQLQQGETVFRCLPDLWLLTHLRKQVAIVPFSSFSFPCLLQRCFLLPQHLHYIRDNGTTAVLASLCCYLSSQPVTTVRSRVWTRSRTF